MKKDFPSDELKPYALIYRNIKNNECIALGYYEDNILKGYATIMIAGNVLLLDYYAILSEYRNQGLGTSFLKELSDYFKDYDVLLIESESEDTPVARKRIDFYKRCGCKDSGVRGTLYFVDYVLLYKELSKTYTKEEIEDVIHDTYHIVYPFFENTKFLIFH